MGYASLAKTALGVVAPVAVGFVVFEVSLDWSLSHPWVFRRMPVAVGVLRDYHRKMDDWKIMQYEPGCARYDPELSYTLAPGGCTVSDREYSVRYEVNAHGLRDDEASMVDPRIVVAGDSYAMGWGVAQSETMAQQLERSLGVPVLNAAVSSYGTARELLLLERLGIRGFETLVVQYCDNDDDENRQYVERGKLDVQTRAEFDATLARYREDSRRYFGKHVRTLLTAAIARIAGDDEDDGDEEEDGDEVAAGPWSSERYFLETLRSHPALIERKIVIVIPECTNRAQFAAGVRALLGQQRYRDIARAVSVIDPEPSLDWDNDFYPLDAHLTARGHARYAGLVEAEIRRRKAQADVVATGGRP